jgi:hypothetical protein
MIEKTGNSMVHELVSQASPEAAVAMISANEAQQSKTQARMQRREAQKERLELMERSARKLKEMANKALNSSIYQGGLGLARTVASCSANLAERELDLNRSLGRMSPNVLHKLKIAGEAIDQGLGAIQQVDAFKIQSDRLEHEKQQIEIRAEGESYEGNEAGDEISEASRRQDLAVRALQQINEARHRAALEASRL